jgi:hypothetical protein
MFPKKSSISWVSSISPSLPQFPLHKNVKHYRIPGKYPVLFLF